jgi:hypothetical protein
MIIFIVKYWGVLKSNTYYETENTINILRRGKTTTKMNLRNFANVGTMMIFKEVFRRQSLQECVVNDKRWPQKTMEGYTRGIN